MSETHQESLNSFSIVVERRIVPNVQPIQETPGYRIALIGDCPSEEDENHRRPFLGGAGRMLDSILRDVGIDRNCCLVGNVCQTRPPGNDLGRFAWTDSEIQGGLSQLALDISNFNPHICVLFGAAALRAARGQPLKIAQHRGSLFICNVVGSPFYNRKCIASVHPGTLGRDFSNFPLVKFDLRRARSEAETPVLTLPVRELITNLDGGTLCYILDNWPSGQRLAMDIEGGLGAWPCVSICHKPNKAITIAFGKLTAYWHGRVLQSFARLAERVDVPKDLQNGLYDAFVLAYGYGLLIRNIRNDTMIKSWEIFAELPRSLAVQTSIWTKEPFYKDDEMYAGTGEGLFLGCAKDSAVTAEISDAQDQVLTPTQRIHYNRMIELLNPFHYMELRGIRYNKDNVAAMLAQVSADLVPVAARLNAVAGSELRGAKGSLGALRLANAMYKRLNYPPQYKKVNGRLTDKLTTDIQAILALKRHRPDDEFLSDVSLHRHLEGIRETLQIHGDPDGRVRCRYSLEAETGRVKCYTSPTGSGANLQTIQKKLRVNYCADPGYDFFQADLEGADGWTVACHSARLGDDTMLKDYLAKMKPAKIIAMMYFLGPEINKLDRDSLKWCHDNIFPIVKKLTGEWVYLGSKRVQHGSNYLMGIPTMLLNILLDSFKESGKPIYMDGGDARILQNLYFGRYTGVPLWHSWGETKLVADGKLTSAAGHTRLFFGRRFGSDIKDTVKEFLAHEPQFNTTWATNLAMLNLWNDRANRVSNVNGARITTCDGAEILWPEDQPGLARIGRGGLLIEPLHQVHDALCGQWPIFLRDWARGKIREYFNNPLTIAGTTITIPFDGAYGPSWGDTPHQI